MLCIAVTVTTEISHSNNESSPVTKECCVLKYSECEVIYTKSNSSKIHLQL